MARFRLPSLEKWVFIGIIVGLISGVAGIILTYSVEFLQDNLFNTVVDMKNNNFLFVLVLLPLLTMLGGLISGILTYYFAPEASGHGTDAVIEAIHRKAGRISLNIPIIKLIASTILLGTGGSAGKEGPIALTGAGFASYISEKMHFTQSEKRLLVLSGMAGGLSAVFKAPLGSLIFSLEVPYKRDVEIEAIVPIAVSSFTAYALSVYVTGTTTLFNVSIGMLSPLEYLAFFALIGIVMGVVARIFSMLFYGIRDFFAKIPVKGYLKPMIGGLMTGLLGILFPEILGQGYAVVQDAMYEENIFWFSLIVIALLKILATSFSVASGGSGGVFAPILVTGGIMANGIARLFYGDIHLVPAATIVGMTSLLAGAGKVPLAAIIMVAEMTNGYQLIGPALVSVALSYIVSGNYTIYEKQVDTRSDSPYFLSQVTNKILSQIKVKEVMTKKVIYVSPRDELKKVMELMEQTGHLGYPVVENKRLVGIITYSDILKKGIDEIDKLKVKDVMSTKVIVAFPDEKLDTILVRMMRYGIGRIPIVKDKDSMELVGIITKKDIIRAYESLRSIMF